MGLTIEFQQNWRIAEPTVLFLHKQFSLSSGNGSKSFFLLLITPQLAINKGADTIYCKRNSIQMGVIGLGPRGQARGNLMFYLNVFIKGL